MRWWNIGDNFKCLMSTKVNNKHIIDVSDRGAAGSKAEVSQFEATNRLTINDYMSGVDVICV